MDLSSVVLSNLADASVRSLCLAVLTFAALRLGRVRSVSVRHAVWTVTVGAMLLLPCLTPFLPAIPLPILPNTKAVLSPPAPSVASSVYASEPSALGNRPPSVARPTWQQLGFALYLGVLLIMLGRLLVSYLLVRRLVRSGALILDARARGVLERLASGRGPALRESGWISAPMTAGCIRPVILLPLGWREWDQAKLEAALVHELAHVCRRDPLIALLAGLNKCIFWFHPQAWWMERKLASLAEEAADDRSVLVLGDRRRYASALLEIAAAVRAGRGRLVWGAIAMARPSEVRRRIERVLDETRQLSGDLTKARWMALAFSSVPLLCGAAALQLRTAPVPLLPQAVVSPVPADVQKREARLRAELETPYRRWVQEDVAYIITPEELAAFKRLTSDAERETFIEQFWLKRDPTPGTLKNELKEEHYRRIAYANERFQASEPGWKTDRGRVYIIFGPPDEIESHPAGGQGAYPHEIWRYRSIPNVGENIEMEFVDKSMTGEYRLTLGPSEKMIELNQLNGPDPNSGASPR